MEQGKRDLVFDGQFGFVNVKFVDVFFVCMFGEFFGVNVKEFRGIGFGVEEYVGKLKDVYEDSYYVFELMEICGVIKEVVSNGI